MHCGFNMERKDFNPYYTSFWGGKIFRWVDIQKIKILKKIIQPEDKVLDVGCGTASITTQFKEIYGLDKNQELLNIAKKKGVKTTCLQLEKEKWPYQDHFFDVVVMIDSIEHIDNVDYICKEIKRVLKKQGTVIIFTPPYDSVTWILAERFHNWITKSPSDHIRPFTIESMSYIIGKYFKTYTLFKKNMGLTLCCI